MGRWRSWYRVSMAWKRSSVRIRYGPPKKTARAVFFDCVIIKETSAKVTSPPPVILPAPRSLSSAVAFLSAIAFLSAVASAKVDGDGGSEG